MAVIKLVIPLIVSTILVSCKSAFVDTLKKCSISDSACQKNLLQSVLRDIGKTGIPELNVNPVDPLEIKELHIAVLNLINLTITEGTVKGVRSCDVLKYINDFDTGHASVEILCDISIKGKYKASSTSPLLQTFLGSESVHGNGNGKVKIEKLKITFDYTFDIVKHNNDLYVNCNFDNAKYTYDVLGKVEFQADNLYVGKEESSQTIVKVMNENWKLIMDSVGKNFMDVAIKYVYDFAKQFFDKVPLKYLINEDLSSHVVN